MDKNTVIAIVLSSIVIIASLGLQQVFFPPQPVETQATTQTSQVNTPAIEPVQTAVSSSLVQPADPAELIAEETVVLETDLVRVEFTNRGGDIISYKLKKHADKNGLVEMANFVTQDNRAFSILLGGADGQVIDQIFNIKKISKTEIGFYRTMTVRNADGTDSTFTLAKQYSFLPDDYMFELKVIIDGDSNFRGLKNGEAGYTIKTSPQIGPDWNAKQDKYEYRKFFHLLEGKKKTVTVESGKTKTITDKVTWSGVAGKYFALIAVPEIPMQSVVYSAVSGSVDSSADQVFVTRSPVDTVKSTDVWRFYVGPRTEKNLARYNVATNNPYGLVDIKLNEVVESSSILGPLEYVLKKIMEVFYSIIPNWGISIILMTILMRLILYPLTKKSSESTLKMQEHAPQMQALQEKYKGNPQKLNEEMAKFYKESGYNPLSGCLPLLIQFPLIFAMYGLFNNYFEFRGAMFIPGWIPDLSQGDIVMNLPFNVPLVNWNVLRALPIVYVISQMLFGKVTQAPGTGQQNSSMKMMMYIMPLMFFFMFYNAPAGLLLYWTLSNFLTLVQQVLINRRLHAKKKDTGLKLVKR